MPRSSTVDTAAPTAQKPVQLREQAGVQTERGGMNGSAVRRTGRPSEQTGMRDANDGVGSSTTVSVAATSFAPPKCDNGVVAGAAGGGFRSAEQFGP